MKGVVIKRFHPSSAPHSAPGCSASLCWRPAEPHPGCLVSAGGPDNQVHFESYQVSNQCMALVRDECLLPCRDAPELGYAKESSSEQYVPDVFFKVRRRRTWTRLELFRYRHQYWIFLRCQYRKFLCYRGQYRKLPQYCLKCNIGIGKSMSRSDTSSFTTQRT